VKACRKLDADGQVSAPVAAWEAALERQFRAVGTGPIGGRRSGLSETCGVGASQAKAVLALVGEVIRHPADRGDKSACGQGAELSGADNARESCCSRAEQPKDGGVLIAAGEHGVNCAATQGWRCRQRLSGASSVEFASRLALSA